MDSPINPTMKKLLEEDGPEEQHFITESLRGLIQATICKQAQYRFTEGLELNLTEHGLIKFKGLRQTGMSTTVLEMLNMLDKEEWTPVYIVDRPAYKATWKKYDFVWTPNEFMKGWSRIDFKHTILVLDNASYGRDMYEIYRPINQLARNYINKQTFIVLELG